VPPLAAELASEVAALLAAETGSADLAFVRQRDTVYFSRRADELRSAPVVLIQGICAALPRDAHFILRNQILATREPGPFALGMVKVAAKRLRVVAPAAAPRPGALEAAGLRCREVLSAEPPLLSLPSVPDAGAPATEWLRFSRSLIGPVDEERPLHARDRRVGAALVAPSGELLAAAANTNGADRTRHAELNALLAHWQRRRERLPRGARLYVTLRPCRMCAGLVWELAAAPGSVLVHFEEDDPGPAARETILHPGSALRRRFARSADELAAPGCFQVSRPAVLA